MEPELEELRKQLTSIREDEDKLTSGLSDAQLTWRPAETAWSITECLAHLISVDGQDVAMLFREISLARKNGITGKGPFRYGWLSGKFVKSLEPPAKFKFKAPKAYVPPPQPDPRETILEFRRLQNDLHYLVGQADGLDLAKIKVPTPVSKWIKFSLGRRLQVLTAHDRRHLYQAWQVRNHPSFPAE